MIETIGVVGAGTMGAGIAQLACIGRYRTLLHDPDTAALSAGAKRVRDGLAKGAERGRWSADEAEAASARLELAEALEDLAGCDLVIEAAPERLEVKRELFGKLAAICAPDAILATNTSSLPVAAIAASTPNPERVAGMHFFNPPPLMRLVEVVAAEQTAEPVAAEVMEVARRMDRVPVRAADQIGFLANRCARPYSLEALRLLGSGIATVEQIDRIARIGGGYRMGPFELTDLVGIDVNLSVATSFWEQSFHEPRWQPHPIQQSMVDAGRLGRKSGRGYYSYGEGTDRDEDPPPGSGFSLEPAANVLEGKGFRAVCVESASLAALAPGEDLVGFVAIPDPPRARLVELTRGDATSDASADAAEEFFAARVIPVEWVGDVPGLVLGRIVAQLVNEAFFALQSSSGTREDIDTALTLGLNHPRGPFEWLKQIGPARIVAILDGLRAELGEERYRVPPLLRREAGRSVA